MATDRLEAVDACRGPEQSDRPIQIDDKRYCGPNPF